MPAKAPEGDMISVATAAANALDQTAELITDNPAGVTSVEPDDDHWLAEVEVLEERRIPPSCDLLALYELELDAVGELVAYRLTKRYTRRDTDTRVEAD